MRIRKARFAEILKKLTNFDPGTSWIARRTMLRESSVRS
jgi:hypothetical protein